MFALVLTAALSGCGGDGDDLPREAVSGTVEFDGAPLDRGQIQFFANEQDLPTRGSAMIADGKFSIPRNEGLVPGKYRVVINSPEEGGAAQSKDTVNDMPGMPSPPPKDRIPSNYNVNSKLSEEIKAGSENVLTFKLEKSTSKK